MKRVIQLSAIFCIVLIVMTQNGFSQMFVNSAGVFNGTSSYLAIPNNAELNPTAAITLEAWVYPTATTSAFPEEIIGKNWSSSYSLAMYQPSSPLAGRLCFYPSGGGSGVWIVSKTPLPLNKWSHIAVTYNGTGTYFYLNGFYDTSSAQVSGPIAVNTDSVYIGCERVGTVPAYFFSGNITGVRIWSIARPQADIMRDMNIPLTMHFPSGLYAGLLASYPYISDPQTFDWSGSVNNTAYVRNIGILDLSQKITEFYDYNNNVKFDGITAYLAGGNVSDYNATTGITLEAWVKRDTTGTQASNGNVVNKSGGTSRYDYGLWVNSDGSVSFGLNNGINLVTTPNGLVSLARWYHLAVTYAQTTGAMTMYINGDSVSGNVIGGIAINNNPDSLCIGGISATSYFASKFKGQIDGVRIWKNVARTRAQIIGNMYRCVTPDGALPCVEYTFDSYTNAGHGSGNGYYVGAPLMFNGSAKITSEHRNLNNELSSPMLSANELGYYSTSDNAFSTKRFFIPDGSAAGITDSVYVNAGGTVTDLTAFVLINQTWVSDIILTFTSPTGVSVMLTPASGNSAANDLMTIFTSAADSTYGFSNLALFPYSPKVKPTNPFTPFIGTVRSGWWKMKFTDPVPGDIGYVNGWGIKIMSVTGTGNETNSPYKFELNQNFPNPFNPVTRINFTIPVSDNVKIEVFDITGKSVNILTDQKYSEGHHSVQFTGDGISSGVYFYKLTTSKFTDVKRMILLK
ncbi:MAG: LamG-like jellyroll fold domain-containing protein [Ignavibacteria bacterium]